MGDFQQHFSRPDTGINTVEGNVAGSRAAGLSKKRAAEQAEFEAKAKKIRDDADRQKLGIDAKFDTNTNVSKEEQTFRSKTVGLVSAADFKKASAEVEKSRTKKGEGIFGEDDDGRGEDGVGGGSALSEKEQKKLDKERKKAKKKALKEKKKRMAALSFGHDEEVDEEEEDIDTKTDSKQSNKDVANEIKASLTKKKTIMKNPDVNTSFLPDKEREQKAIAERERLRKEWIDRQKAMKEEILEITYSYWDGTGHRRTVQCKKGDTVGSFLELVRKDLAKDFREMQSVSSDALLYVKEDLIIPQDISFYDLIATRARGKSGPLFNFDVHDDIRLGAVDARMKRTKVIPERLSNGDGLIVINHIFPASRWEIYDPAKTYGSYSIHGGES